MLIGLVIAVISVQPLAHVEENHRCNYVCHDIDND